MATSQSEPVQTWRDDVRDLLGVRWGTAAEWLIIGWLSLWFWASQMTVGHFQFPNVGPFTWLIDIFKDWSIGAPRWLAQLSGWLAGPVGHQVYPCLVAAAAICATLSIRHHGAAGLRIIALISGSMSLEARPSIVTVAWIVTMSVAPAVVACAVAIRDRLGPVRDRDEVFVIEQVVKSFLIDVVGLYLLPVLAPIFLAAFLVTSYRIDLARPAHEELTSEVLRALDKEKSTLLEMDARLAFGALAAMVDSTSGRPSTSLVAWQYLWSLKRPRGSKV
jgi:succinate dehydrogenase/fumarate reductase cytochrome b subunit